MQIIISKSTVITLARKSEQIDMMDKMLFRTAELFEKAGLPTMDDMIWKKFVEKMVKGIGNSSLQKAITVLVSTDKLVIDLNDEFIIDTIDLGGDLLMSAMKLISTLQKQSTADAKSYSDKWITKVCPLVKQQDN